MKNILIGLLLVLLTTLSACDDGLCDCDRGPFFGELQVKLTINDDNPEVLLTIMEGNIESADTVISEYVNEKNVYYDLEADRYYSAVVTYNQGIRRITAVDGKRMRLTDDDCGCDYAKDITLNLRLAN
ncbi:hypothetical protein [Marinoscillum sp.]|uniref:hypothetical protein n=1 Tax=Marinoscillum sp. TaxID=2024838 RepID=UPI003BA98C12